MLNAHRHTNYFWVLWLSVHKEQLTPQANTRIQLAKLRKRPTPTNESCSLPAQRVHSEREYATRSSRHLIQITGPDRGPASQPGTNKTRLLILEQHCRSGQPTDLLKDQPRQALWSSRGVYLTTWPRLRIWPRRAPNTMSQLRPATHPSPGMDNSTHWLPATYPGSKDSHWAAHKTETAWFQVPPYCWKTSSWWTWTPNHEDCCLLCFTETWFTPASPNGAYNLRAFYFIGSILWHPRPRLGEGVSASKSTPRGG